VPRSIPIIYVAVVNVFPPNKPLNTLALAGQLLGDGNQGLSVDIPYPYA
jgi:hypothetical protein